MEELKIIDELLNIIWGSKAPKTKKKRTRDKKGRYTRRKK